MISSALKLKVGHFVIPSCRVGRKVPAIMYSMPSPVVDRRSGRSRVHLPVSPRYAAAVLQRAFPRRAGLGVVGNPGFEPGLTESESAVLPLDEFPPRSPGTKRPWPRRLRATYLAAVTMSTDGIEHPGYCKEPAKRSSYR